MKRALSLVLTAGLVVAGAGILRAQKPAPKPVPNISAQDLSRLSSPKIREQVQALMAAGTGEPYPPLQLVVQFLQLTPAQVDQLEQLLEGRQAALAPLVQAVQQLENQLGALLQSGGTPAQIGQTVIQIYMLQQRILQVQQVFLSQWVNLLDQDQRQRLDAVRLAVALQPVVPAFQQLQLF